MKKIYFFLLGILLTVGLTAQPFNQGLKVQLKGVDKKLHTSVIIRSLQKNDRAKYNELDPLILLKEQLTLKSATVIKQKLDSIVYEVYDTINTKWRPDNIEKYTYDAQGRNTSYITFSWDDQTQRLEPDSKTENNYDSNNRLSAYHNYDWDTVANVAQWVEKYKIMYSYGSGNLVSETLTYLWDDETKILMAARKTVFTYDSKGNSILELSYSWDTDVNNWVVSSKYQNSYDANNNQTIHEYSISMGENMWISYYKFEYTYNSQGKILTESYYSLDYFSQTLAISSKDVYTYDSNGNNTLTISSYWENNAWVNSWKEENTYNASHRLLTTKEYDWNTVSGAWKPDWSEEITYDANGNMALSTYYNGDEAGNWVKDSKTEGTYNNTYSSSELLFPSYFGINITEFISKMITGTTDYDWINGQWRYDSKTTFHYSAINITSADKFSDANIRVYPNPATDVINIYTGSNLIDHVSLYSLSGNLIKFKNFSNQTNLTVGELSSGIYFIKIKSPDKPDYLQKIIVR